MRSLDGKDLLIAHLHRSIRVNIIVKGHAAGRLARPEPQADSAMFLSALWPRRTRFR